MIILSIPGGSNAFAAGVPCPVSDIEAFLLDTQSACGSNFNEIAPLAQLDAFTFSGVYAYTAIAHEADNSIFTSESINGFPTFSNQASSIANEWGSLKYVDFDSVSGNIYFNDSTDGPSDIPLNPHSFNGVVEDYLKVYQLTAASNVLSYLADSITLPPGTIIVGFNDNAAGGDADYDDIIIAMYPDQDYDGVADGLDNCPNDENITQEDIDQDGVGDICDSCPEDPENDSDGDGICQDVDNCPAQVNPLQEDVDGDGLGNVCDPTQMGENESNQPEVTTVISPLQNKPSASVTVTVNPLPAVGDILVVPPDESNVSYRLINSAGEEVFASQILDGRPCVLSEENLVMIPADGQPSDFNVQLPLSESFPDLPPGNYTVIVSYDNSCDETFDVEEDEPPCPGGPDCFQNVYQVVQEAEEVDFTIGSGNEVDQCPDDGVGAGLGAKNTGCQYAVANKSVLWTLFLYKGPFEVEPQSGVEVRLFNRNDPEFKAEFGRNPSGRESSVIFESLLGFVGACTTDGEGHCAIGVVEKGRYMAVARFIDSTASKSVYVSRMVNPNEFRSNRTPKKRFPIVKIFQKGEFKSYLAGRRTEIVGSYLKIISPDSAIWEGKEQIYPFIFSSDSNWKISVCGDVSADYDIAGVYDENGSLVAASNCVRTDLAGKTKAIAFRIRGSGPTEPFLDAKFKILNPKGKPVKKRLISSDVRKQSFKSKLRMVRAKKMKEKKIERRIKRNNTANNRNPKNVNQTHGYH